MGLDALKNDPALTYFRTKHYHRPRLLDCRVRNGNGYFQPGMGTGRRLRRAFSRDTHTTIQATGRTGNRNSGCVMRPAPKAPPSLRAGASCVTHRGVRNAEQGGKWGW